MWMNDEIVFYHIPKTGGRWVTSAMMRSGVKGLRRARPKGKLRPLGLRREHAVPADLGADRAGKFEFAFVRQPVGWFESFWGYRCRTRDEAASTDRPDRWRDPFFALDRLWDNDLVAFVERVLDAWPEGFVTAMYQCYLGTDGKALNFIGKMESLEDDFLRAMELAKQEVDEGIARGIGRKNVNLGSHKIPDELAAQVNATERWILETFYA